MSVVMQVSELLDSNRQMQEELMEKGQAIRVLQQKLADLKKTLQKELVCLALLVVYVHPWSVDTCPHSISYDLCLTDAEIPLHWSCPLGNPP